MMSLLCKLTTLRFLNFDKDFFKNAHKNETIKEMQEI